MKHLFYYNVFLFTKVTFSWSKTQLFSIWIYFKTFYSSVIGKGEFTVSRL